MMNKKKVILISIIIVLAVVMILVGVVFASGDKDNTKKETKKITLSCNLVDVNNYNITINTLYENDEIKSIEMIYEPPLDEEVHDMKNDTAKTVMGYASLQGVTYASVDNVYHIFLDKRAYDANKDNKAVADMFVKYNELQSYYQKLGYTCK